MCWPSHYFAHLATSRVRIWHSFIETFVTPHTTAGRKWVCKLECVSRYAHWIAIKYVQSPDKDHKNTVVKNKSVAVLKWFMKCFFLLQFNSYCKLARKFNTLFLKNPKCQNLTHVNFPCHNCKQVLTGKMSFLLLIINSQACGADTFQKPFNVSK